MQALPERRLWIGAKDWYKSQRQEYRIYQRVCGPAVEPFADDRDGYTSVVPNTAAGHQQIAIVGPTSS